jgi:hypothetical protein
LQRKIEQQKEYGFLSSVPVVPFVQTTVRGGSYRTLMLPAGIREEEPVLAGVTIFHCSAHA